MGTSVKPLTEQVAHADDLPPLRAQPDPAAAPDLRDWLPPDHLAYDIADLVDTLDLAPSTRRTRAMAAATAPTNRP